MVTLPNLGINYQIGVEAVPAPERRYQRAELSGESALDFLKRQKETCSAMKNSDPKIAVDIVVVRVVVKVQPENRKTQFRQQ
jgi:hypothetical protein